MPLSFLFLALFLAAPTVVPAPVSHEAVADTVGRLVRPVVLRSGASEYHLPDIIYSPSRTAAPVFMPDARVSSSVSDDGRTLRLEPAAEAQGLRLVRFVVGGDTLGLPVEIRRPAQHTFVFRPDLAPPEVPRDEPVFVIGQFNDWSRSTHRLVDAGGGALSITLDVEPGRYQYKYQVGPDGATALEVMDPENPIQVPNGLGGFNNIVEVLPVVEGRAWLRPVGWARADGASRFDFSVHADGAALGGVREMVVLLDNRPAHDSAISINGETISISLPSHASGTLRLAADMAGLVTPWVEVPLLNGAPREAAGGPFTWHDAIVYQIMIDRFRDGDPDRTNPVDHPELDARANYHGGDLAGIVQTMEEGYFADLGVNVLWLSPVYRNPDQAYREYPAPHRYYTGYHGYWPISSTEVDPRFGDLAALRGLVTTAHARETRVLLDFVANHVHEQHPLVAQNRDWFGTLTLPDGRQNLRLWDEQRLTTWFEPYLPSFDFEAVPEAVAFMTENAAWWLRETGADGFRHDAVKHIPNDFWRDLTDRLRTEVEPDRALPIYQIGETFGSYDLIASYVNPGQMDAQFNFSLYDTALHVFLREQGRFDELAAEMQRSLDVYGPLHLMGNLMDSHDKPRFLALVDGDIPDGVDDKEPGWGDNPSQVDNPESYRIAELYMAYMLAIPGVPVIYYGDEIGMTGANDPDNRRPMRFDPDLTDDERTLKSAVSRLVHLRNDLPALRYGHFETLHADHDTWLFLRATPGSGVIVALNKSTEDQQRTLPSATDLEFVEMVDAISGDALLSNESITIPARGYRVLALTR